MPTKLRESKGRIPRVAKTTRKELSVTERATITSLVQEAGWKQERVADLIKVGIGTVGKTVRRAITRAKENQLPLADISNYQSTRRSGQPRKLTPEQGDEICTWIVSCKAHRDMQAWEVIAKLHLDISDSLLFQTMYDHGYSRKKHGWKPILSTPTKKHRKDFATAYLDFDWKGRAVTTDELSMRMGEIRGKLRSWQKEGEKYNKDVVEGKSDGYSCGQMWASIGYDLKSPCHFHLEETEAEKREAQLILDRENLEDRKHHYTMWIASQGLQSLRYMEKGRKAPGVPPKYENYLKRQMMMREDRTSKQGVDWFRHREGALKKLIPWVIEQKERTGRDLVVIEDNAPCHNKKWCTQEFHKAGVKRFGLEVNGEKLMQWPPNSPDLNASEQPWAWGRRHLIHEGKMPDTVDGTVQMWKDTWEALPQEKINAWIERIPKVLQRVIDHDGDNDFHS